MTESLPKEDQENQNLASEGKENALQETDNPKVSKKAGKKKKMSKKELARLRREKAEQERLEMERKIAEEKALKEQEEELKRRKEQQQRLMEETDELMRIRKERDERGWKVVAEKDKADDWEIFSRCDHSVDTRSESDVNTFISQWKEVDDNDMSELFKHIKIAKSVITQLTDLYQFAEVTNQSKQVERCAKQIRSLEELVKQKLENATVHHLVFSDKITGTKSDVQISGGADDLNFGMWVNLAKNPRIKDISFFDGVYIEIPKTIAMASIAIRVSRYEEQLFNDEYLFIDRLLQCDFIQLPAPPKKVSTMTLRQSLHSGSLVKISYPLKNVTSQQPPLNFRMQLCPESINEHTSDATIVLVTPDGKAETSCITNCVIDGNEVSFSASSVGIFGLAVPRYRHFPIQVWEISGQSPTSVKIYIRTAILEMTFAIDEDGLVSLDSPVKFEKLTPGAAFRFLERKGINITAPPSVGGIIAKDENVEDVIHRGIADCAVGFSIKPSKWNSGLPSDRAMLLVREKVDYDENKEENDDENTTKTRAILIKALQVAEVVNTEQEEECSQKPPSKDFQIHQDLLPMFFDSASDEVKKRVLEAPPFLCNSVLLFAKRLRLFSVTQ